MTIHIPAGAAPRSAVDAAVAALRSESAPRIPAGLYLQGEASFPCHVVLEGTIEGTVTVAADATLMIAKDALVNGKISGGNAYVEGTVLGEIDCSHGAVEFGPTARCNAAVMYRELSVARGAEVEAKLQQKGAARG